MLTNDKEPIVIELDLKKLMIDNFVITSGLVILFIAIQYICFKDFHFSFWKMIGGTALFVVLYIIFIILHEACHLIGFMIFGRVPFKALKYNELLVCVWHKFRARYCLCNY